MRKISRIWIVTPENYVHSQCFNEVALAMKDALKKLGQEIEITTDLNECILGETLIFGAHLLLWTMDKAAILQVSKGIVFNLEQQFSENYVTILSVAGEVWEYSKVNLEYLVAIGLKARHCEIGYMPCLTKIDPAPVEDIDVLMYGSLNERRLSILRELGKYSKVQVLGIGVYDSRRDNLIARSKIVLNIHYYEPGLFEIVRCSYLMANRKCIVSEVCDLELDVMTYYASGIVFAEPATIVKKCLRILGDDNLRKERAQKSFELFSARSQVEILKPLLEK